MIVRDLDVLAEAARRAEVSVTFSIPTLDEEIWRRTEPGTAPPRQRLRALKQLVDAGIKASVGMAPILPGLSDKPELMADVVRAAREAGATGIWANLLYLKAGHARALSSAASRATGPSSCPSTSGSTRGRAYLGADEAKPVQATGARSWHAEHGIRDRRRVAEPPEARELAGRAALRAV